MRQVHWRDKYKNVREYEIEPNSRNEAEQELIIFELAQALCELDANNELVHDVLFGLTDERANELYLNLSNEELTCVTGLKE